MQHANSDNIHVDVSTRFIEQHSDPEEDRFVFGYHITIRNDGPSSAQDVDIVDTLPP